MSCRVMLCYVMLCYVILYYIILYYIILYYIILYYIILYYMITENSDNKPRGLFLAKRPFRIFFFSYSGGGRGAYTWTNICVFKKDIFYSSICNFLRFSARNLSLLLNFHFLFLIMYLQLLIPHCIVIKYLPPKFKVMFKFNYSKYNPRGLIFGGLIHGRSLPFQKLVPKRSGAYTRWGLLSECDMI